MSDLSLPIFDRSASAQEALAGMRRLGISGAVALHQGGFRLYTAGQVVVAISENPDVTLVDMTPARELNPSLPRDRRSSGNAYLIASVRDAASRESIEGSNEIVFSVEAELFNVLQGSPQDCYCKVDGKPVPGGKTGADCPDGHSSSVRCV
jgi:hypothetical protein